LLVRSILFNAALYLNFILLGVLFSPVLLLPSRFGWRAVHAWANATLWLHRAICGIGEDLRGLENIPGGGIIVVSKHQSAWETLRLVSMFPRPTFILKRELMWIPLFGWYLKKFGQIPVDRGGRAAALEAMTQRAREAIADGRQIIIFPEGTRRSPLAPPDYKYGVVRLYRELRAPVLPVALNSGLFWPRRAIAHRPGTIALNCLPPIQPGQEPDRFFAELKAEMEGATAALVEEAFARDPKLADTVRRDSEANGATT
jgi:1-acyl-sn-glycerol-3-phosphate acyltransferase